MDRPGARVPYAAIVHVADELQRRMDETGSVACVGLDPRPELLPPDLIERMVARHGDTAAAVGAAFVEFNARIIDAIADACPAVKPQAACYEAYGHDGWAALETTVATARAAGLSVIVDGKRNDIGSTAVHYRQAFFGDAPGLLGQPLSAMHADWVTVNGYLASDTVTPFLDGAPGARGIFVLVKTSNPSSGELQDRLVVSDDAAEGGDDGDGHEAAGRAAPTRTVAETMAALVRRWGTGRTGTSGLSDVGAVVGATYPAQAEQLRSAMPDALFLVPGYGAQGGTAADALAGCRPDGRGVLVSSSRGIIGAWQVSGGADGARVDWGEAARAALDEMNQHLAHAQT
jgi:orotidine-5'-phosphate decarboxylase